MLRNSTRQVADIILAPKPIGVVTNVCVVRPLSTAASREMPSVSLYQYTICPFCSKAKTFLDYAGVRYESIEVSPLTKTELKPWSGDYRKVPIAIMDGKQVNGSDDIVSVALEHPAVVASLETKWKNNMTMGQFRASASSLKWQKFANDDLASLLYPNICRTIGDSYKAFGYVNSVPTFSAIQKTAIRSIGSLAMYFAASKIKSKRGIDDERQALDEILTVWERDGLGNDRPFASSMVSPDLGDLAVFGVLRAIEGLPAHFEAIEERGGVMQAWYNRMKKQLETEISTEED